MALDLHDQWFRGLSELRLTRTTKRLRASRHGHLLVDTTDALLVWEPRRVVPEYAVPPDAFAANGIELVDLPRRELPDGLPPVLGPLHFELHTCPGTPVAVREGAPDDDAGGLVEVGFRPDDPDLGGRVVLDFALFDWVEEDQPVMGHAHDPWKRIDVLRSDRHVVVSLAGTVLAESRRALAVYETALPTRWYLPVDDVRMDLLTPSQTHTVCAYKGRASYLGTGDDVGADIAWFYPDPLDDAVRLQDHVAFWSERCEVLVDGERLTGGMPDAERPAAGSL
ncbi:DUF427 domain-containing protein [Phycicoccus sp. Root101]|jgi:uncharacterized protein (DUF427 family)|uniref:DUF427 domain-containing protein n=1 Tax=Phycicoccus sp. Root101 TaxID=1736421 RepID=UPI000702F01F|nr:DUF427 domain-containing protein [Phycicoccus sp. Root101]KQU68468.1 hypothetical protein ASC58_06935 [Phycicoccus sp. Root101]